jgi:hypothetical protein
MRVSQGPFMESYEIQLKFKVEFNCALELAMALQPHPQR